MAVTINVNRLSLVHAGSDGVSRATLPDVCHTKSGPPAAYPNTSFSRDLADGTLSVVADGENSIAVRGSAFARSVGHAPEAIGGIKSGVRGKESTWLSYSYDIKIEGRNACRLTDKMLHNRGNTIDCAGEMQPVVREGGTVLDFGRVYDKDDARYSLRAKVMMQPPTPPAVEGQPPPRKPKPVLVEDARVRITEKKKARSWEGDTRPDTRHRNKKGTCTFKRLVRGSYKIEIYHDCYAEDRRNKRVRFVKANPTKHPARMVSEKLIDVANKRGVPLGARCDLEVQLVFDEGGARQFSDNPLSRENMTMIGEFNDIVVGSFLASRCGDAYMGIPQNRTLTDLSYNRQTKQFAQVPSFDFAPSQEVRDQVAAAGRTGELENNVFFTNSQIWFAQKHKKQLQITPLVWPGPLNTPGWAGGNTTKKGDAHMPYAQSYVARRSQALVAAGVADLEKAENIAVMEVHENFIRNIIRRFKGHAFERSLVPGTPPVMSRPSYVVVNECLNMRYHDEQENATPDKEYAREHPFWQRFGVWELDETRTNQKNGFRDHAIDAEGKKKLWENIARCFEIAHEEDPEATLILNDYNVEGMPDTLDFTKHHRRRENAQSEALKKRKATLEGTKARGTEEAKPGAEDDRKEALDKAKAKRDKRYGEKRPAAVGGSGQAYGGALRKAGADFDNAVNPAANAYVKAIEKAEADYKGYSQLEDAYKTAAKAAEDTYAGALTKATNDYKTAIDAAEAKYSADLAAEAAAGKAPANAAAVHAAQQKDEAERHAAALKYAKAVHAAQQKYWKAHHKAWNTWRKGHTAAERLYRQAEKPQLFYELARWLMTKRLPKPVRDRLAIGFQMHHPDSHIRKGYAPEAIARNVRRYADLSLPVIITELDVSHQEFRIDHNQKALDAWEKKYARWKERRAARRARGANGAGPQEPKKPPRAWQTFDGTEEQEVLKARCIAALGGATDPKKIAAEASKLDKAIRADVKKQKEEHRKQHGWDIRVQQILPGILDAHCKEAVKPGDAAKNKRMDDAAKRVREQFINVYRDQAERFRKMIEACLGAKNCIGFTTWNVWDNPDAFRYMAYWFHPKWPCTTPGCATHNTPGQWDRKPSYTASVSAFLRARKQYTEGEIHAGRAKRG